MPIPLFTTGPKSHKRRMKRERKKARKALFSNFGGTRVAPRFSSGWKK